MKCAGPEPGAAVSELQFLSGAVLWGGPKVSHKESEYTCVFERGADENTPEAGRWVAGQCVHGQQVSLSQKTDFHCNMEE